MTIETNADVRTSRLTSEGIHTTGSTTFTFRAPSDIAITNVVFKNGNNVVSGTNSASGSEYTVTLAANTTFTGFNVTFGYISGSCGTNATWTLSKQDGQYTKLTISGSGAMSNYSGTTAPWGYDLTSVTIGDGITSIGNYAFTGCTSLQRIDIQRNGAVTLGSNVFDGALQYIVFPNPSAALANTTGNWSGLASKLRVEFGDYLFSVTNEGGTDAYAITNETDLRNLASAINGGSEDIANGKTFRQTGDITLSNTNFEPISINDYHYFSGIYDGGGDYTISGLNIGNLIYHYNYGLFGYVKNGTVKNVRLVSPTVNGDGTTLGALIGKTHNATVKSCVVFNPTILGSADYKGSIIGSNSSSTLQNLYFYDSPYGSIGQGYSGTNVGRARKVILGSGIGSVTPAIDPTATSLDNGFVYNDDLYYREGLELTLTTSLSGQTGYHITYKASYNNGNKTLTGNTYTVNGTDGDVTLTAENTNNTYTVHFNKNHTGATGTMSDQAFTYDVTQKLTANAFTRTGYTFAGWATSANGNVVYSDLQSVKNLTAIDGGTVTLYAKWTPITYYVAFHGNGSTAGSMSNQSFTYDVAKNLTANAYTRTGYTFAGWATSDNGDVVYEDQESVSNLITTAGGTVDLYAKWTPITYTVKFYANGGSGTMSDQSFYYDVAQDLTANAFTRTGYTFAGWAMSANGDVVYSDQQSVKNLTATDGGTVTLYAKWTPITYYVAFHGNGSTAGSMSNQSFTYDVAKNLTANAYTHFFTVTYDYNGATGGNSQASATVTATFNGWAKSAGGAKVYDDQQSVTNLATTNSAIVDLYAKWIADGSVTLPTPTKTGYTFAGWYSDSGLNTSVGAGGASYTPSANIKLYAKWTANTYTVKFYANGGSGTMSDQAFYYDVAQDLTANAFTRTGYTFAGWAMSANGDVLYADQESVINLITTDGGTVDLYAKWTPITYTVHFNGNGGICGDGEMSEQTFTYDVEQALTANAYSRAFTVTYNYNEATGANSEGSATATATFNGWAESKDGEKVYDDGQPVSNLTTEDHATVNLYANWTDGSVTLPTSTKTGYTLAWYSDAGLTVSVGNAGESYTPSEDITLYARWTIATYTINYELDGGSVATPNPTSYTIETPTFELNNPTKENYHFVGWTEGDNNTLLPTVTIEQGSTGNLIYKAHYGINNFTVGEFSYQWTSGTEVKVTACNNSATSVTIPATVTNEDLTYSVTAIGITAFYGCNSLTSIEIPSSVTSIGEAAFLQCTSLTSITIPSGVKSIGDWTFYGCNSLKSIEIPEGVTSIGESAFFECTSLTSITIPSSVMSIGEAAFRGCTDLESISVVAENARYYSGGNCIIETESHKLILGCNNSVIPYGVTSIGEYAFEGCTGLTSITIPSSVTSIGIAAFEDCTSLASIEIPASVTSIGYEAFMNCTSLTSIEIPSGVTSIGDATFYGCTSLASIEIPASVTSIGDWVFQGCTDLESISVASGNVRYHSEGNCIIETESHTLIQGCKTTVIPDDVTTIGGYAFQGCTGLTSIKIPASVSSISVGSFYGCSGLESVTVESENTTYDSRNNCNAIIETETNTLLKGCVNTVIPDDVTTISRQAFKKIPSLTSIEIPASVTSIGNEAFQGCSLTSVTIYAPSLTTYGQYAFDDNAEGFKMYVFRKSLDTYKAHEELGVAPNDVLPIENINLKDAADNRGLIAAADGESLTVTLQGRKLYKDGAWNTLCLPFDVSTTSGPLSGDNVEAMVLVGDESGLQGTTLTLNFDNAPATIPAGTPFIIRWGTPQNNLGTSFTDPVFSGVTVSDATNRDVTFTGGSFKGTYKSITYDDEDQSILFLGAKNTLYWPKPSGDNKPTIGAQRAYFELDDPEAPVRQFVLRFGEEGEAQGITSPTSLTPGPSPTGEGSIYTLSGVKVSAPSVSSASSVLRKGLYIVNGRKVVIK